MKPYQNGDGHVYMTAREYDIGTSTQIAAGAVVKLSSGKVVLAGVAESGAVLGIAKENHKGAADALNPRANGTKIQVYDNPALLIEVPAPVIAAASGSATTLVPKSGDVDADAADDYYNGAVLQLVKKAASSTNTDYVGKLDAVADYAKTGTIMTKASGGAPNAGDEYRLYPAIGGNCLQLTSDGKNVNAKDAGASVLRCVGHDYERGMIRYMFALHALGNKNS